MISITSEQALVLAILLCWAIGIISVAITVYLAKMKLELMESFLPSAVWISQIKAMLGHDNWPSRLYRLNTISVALMFPKVISRRGEVKLHELYNIPTKLRYLMKITHIIGISSALLIGAAYLTLKIQQYQG